MSETPVATPPAVVPQFTSSIALGRTPRSRANRDSELIAHQHSLVQNATKLAEYEWPPIEYGAHKKTRPDDDDLLWMVQEQVGNFLNMVSFKRKYPEIERHRIDANEAAYLSEQGLVTDGQISLGLYRIKSADVHVLMQKDYPEKYDQFLDELSQREKKEFAAEHRRYANLLRQRNEEGKNNPNKVELVMKTEDKLIYNPIKVDNQVLLEARQFSHNLNRRRKYIFTSFYDECTNTVQYPKDKKYKKLDPELTRPHPKYPCQVMPGQYSAYHVKYTPEELKYLPLQQVVRPGLRKEHKLRALVTNPNYRIENKIAPADIGDLEKLGIELSDSEPEDENSQLDGGSDNDEIVIKIDEADLLPGGCFSKENMNLNGGRYSGEESDDALSTTSSVTLMVCSICGKDEKSGYFVFCTKCKRYGHMECLDLSPKILAAIRTYRWQCMECKVCVKCEIEKDEENLLFCDRCDRGYHTHCVGLDKIPRGVWTCEICKPFEDDYQRSISDYKNRAKTNRDSLKPKEAETPKKKLTKKEKKAEEEAEKELSEKEKAKVAKKELKAKLKIEAKNTPKKEKKELVTTTTKSGRKSRNPKQDD